jgi:hypothetical protein
MKTQQEWVKDILFSIISLMKTNQYNGDINDEGYRYTINGALDNYSQTYWDRENGGNINLYHKYDKFGKHFYRNVLMSYNAYQEMKKFSENKELLDIESKNNEIKKLCKKLHGEHMTPQSYTRKKLNDLLTLELTDEELKDKIQYALSDAKLCIITKDESKILDGEKKSFSKDEIIDFLNVYKNINGLPKVIESDFTDLKDKSKRSNGFGSIRLYILLKNNVVFVNEKGKTQNFKECMKYLKDGNYYI